MPIPPDVLQRWIALMICRTWSGSESHAGQANIKQIYHWKCMDFDASNRAYAAIVYLKIMHSSTNFQVNLICAKTRPGQNS